MAKIGTFKKQNDGRFTGTINTLTIRVTVELVPTERQEGNGPDFRAWAKGAEIGAAWMQESKAGNPYLSVKLDYDITISFKPKPKSRDQALISVKGTPEPA